MDEIPPVVRTRVVEDVDGMAAIVADGLEAEYVQLEARPFSARWTVVPLRDMVLQFAHEEVALVRRTRVPTGRWGFVVPLAVSESARWNGAAVNGNELFVCPPGSECYGCDPRGTEFAIISVPRRSTAAVLARPFLDAGAGGCTLIPRARDAQALQRRLRNAADATAALDPDDVRDEVGNALDACLTHAVKSNQRTRISAVRHQVVRRAEAFFRSHVGESVSMAQLSSSAMVSERSLRDAFYDTYATSPMRYLRLWQLHQARRALCSPPRRNATVTDVATRHGFYELGRFARDYKALFGERPSQTLRRAVS